MQINVIKVGGAEGVDHANIFDNLARRIAQGEQWIVVHGTSHAANMLANDLGVEVQTLTSPGGHVSRYTNVEMIRIFRLAAAGVNQEMVSMLSARGTKTAGLAGPNIIKAERKKAIRALRNGRQVIIRDDYTGSIIGVEAGMLLALLEAGYTPVLAPIAMGIEFEPLNVDGDLIAATVAKAVEAETLVILTSVPGLLRSVDDSASLIGTVKLVDIQSIEDVAKGRMKKKILAAEQAAVQRFILAGSTGDNPVDAALAGGGTHITA